MTGHVFIKIREVKRRTGLGKTAIYRKIKSGHFPKQIPDITGRVSWLESEVHKWQEDRIRSR